MKTSKQKKNYYQLSQKTLLFIDDFLNRALKWLFCYDKSNDVNITIVLISLLSLYQVISFLPDLFLFLGENSLVSMKVNESFVENFEIRLFLLKKYMPYINYDVVLFLVFFIYVLSISFVIINFKRLWFSFLLWLINFIIFTSSISLMNYGVDSFISSLLFTNVLLCYSESIKTYERKICFLSFVFRCLQLHLCTVYFFAGLGKTMGYSWINGDSVWQSVNTLELKPELTDFLRSLPSSFLRFISLTTCLLQLLFPILVFVKKTKNIVLVLTILSHIFIFFGLGLHLFSLVMISFDLIAFIQIAKLIKKVYRKTPSLY